LYEIAGRDEELASLQAFVGRADGEPVALVLDMLRIEEPALDGCPA
jgi:hypothetical protein